MNVSTIMDITNQLESLTQKALNGDKFSLAKLISFFENTRIELYTYKNHIIEYLKKNSNYRGFFAGITGTPGAGKSTLTGKLALELVRSDPHIRVAILAIDPSSAISGGSLLGDRTRVRLPVEESRIFFRSQASDQELGGLSKHTFSVCRLLYYLFDLIFIETVGIGQSEVEIQNIADHVFLVLQPLTGDQIQFMKAGIMEIPDAFIINKWDQQKEARKTFFALKSILSLVRVDVENIPIFKVSAWSGYGISELFNYVVSLKTERNNKNHFMDKEIHYFEKWVQNQYGIKGLEILKEYGGTRLFLEQMGSFDLALQKFSRLKYHFESLQ